jgi:hypothetical protein
MEGGGEVDGHVVGTYCYAEGHVLYTKQEMERGRVTFLSPSFFKFKTFPMSIAIMVI